MAEKVLRRMDSTGDSVFRFDDTEATAAARAEAEKVFADMLAKGARAFKVNRADGQPDEPVSKFTDIENETVLVPRIVGG